MSEKLSEAERGAIDLNNELHRIMGEINAEFSLLEDDAYCVAARRYFINHWFRFERFGVTKQSQLDPIVVTITRGASADMPESAAAWGDVTKMVSINVSLRGTPLEGKL